MQPVGNHQRCPRQLRPLFPERRFPLGRGNGRGGIHVRQGDVLPKEPVALRHHFCGPGGGDGFLPVVPQKQQAARPGRGAVRRVQGQRHVRHQGCIGINGLHKIVGSLLPRIKMQGRVGTVNPDGFPEGLLPGGGMVVIDGVGQKENLGMGRGQNDTAHGIFPFRPESAQVAAAVDQENRTVQQGEPTHAQKGKALLAGNFIIRYPHFPQQLDFGQCNGVIAQVAVLRGQQEKDPSRMCPLPVCQGS